MKENEEIEDLGKELNITVNVPEEPKKKTSGSSSSALQQLKDKVEEDDEDDDEVIHRASLGKLLGGDVLTSSFVRRQVWLLLLITGFLVVYIATRYSYQNSMIERSKLQAELKDAQYNALSMRSELTQKTRQSKVLDMLVAFNDTTIHIADRPPYIVDVPEEKK